MSNTIQLQSVHIFAHSCMALRGQWDHQIIVVAISSDCFLIASGNLETINNHSFNLTKVQSMTWFQKNVELRTQSYTILHLGTRMYPLFFGPKNISCTKAWKSC